MVAALKEDATFTAAHLLAGEVPPREQLLIDERVVTG